MVDATKTVETNYVETYLQQTVINAIDSLNEEMHKRSISKLIQVEARIFNARKLQMEGVKLDPIPKYELKIHMSTYKTIKQLQKKNAKPDSKVLLFKGDWEIKLAKGKTVPTQEATGKACDVIMGFFMRDCIGLFIAVSEQRLKHGKRPDAEQDNK